MLLALLIAAPIAADARRPRPKKKARAPRQRAVQPSRAAAQPDSAVTYGLDWFLVKDKTVVGPNLGFYSGGFGLDVGASFIWLTEDDPNDVVDSFVGALLGFHVYGRALRSGATELRIGTGLDAWPLFGIDADEWLFSWPVYVEGRYWVSRNWGVGAQVRYQLIHSDGLEPGVERDGSEAVPLLFMLTLGGRSG